MRAGGRDPPLVVHQHDAIGERDGRGAVGDDQRRAAAHHLGEGGADLVLLRRVDGRGRVVEDQHPRIGEDGAGDRQTLALATREREAVLAEERVVAVGELAYELVRAGEARRVLDRLVVGVAVTAAGGEGEVLPDRVAEEERVLEHEPDLATERAELHRRARRGRRW